MSSKLNTSDTRTCAVCCEIFTTNWSYNKCSKCRARVKTKCVECGIPIDRGRSRCMACHSPSGGWKNPTTIDMAWLAGLYEGEGCVVWKTTKRNSSAISLSMTDEDIVRRIHDLTGIGTVVILKPRKDHHKAAWRWSVNKQEDVHIFLNAVLPFLGHRRRERALQALGV